MSDDAAGLAAIMDPPLCMFCGAELKHNEAQEFWHDRDRAAARLCEDRLPKLPDGVWFCEACNVVWPISFGLDEGRHHRRCDIPDCSACHDDLRTAGFRSEDHTETSVWFCANCLERERSELFWGYIELCDGIRGFLPLTPDEVKERLLAYRDAGPVNEEKGDLIQRRKGARRTFRYYLRQLASDPDYVARELSIPLHIPWLKLIQFAQFDLSASGEKQVSAIDVEECPCPDLFEVSEMEGNRAWARTRRNKSYRSGLTKWGGSACLAGVVVIAIAAKGSPGLCLVGWTSIVLGGLVLFYRLSAMSERVEIGFDEGRLSVRTSGILWSGHETYTSIEDVRLCIKDKKMTGQYHAPLSRGLHRGIIGLYIHHNGRRDFLPSPAPAEATLWLGKLIVAGAKANGIWQGKDDKKGEAS